MNSYRHCASLAFVVFLGNFSSVAADPLRPIDQSLLLSTPRSVQFATGRTYVNIAEARIYFSRQGTIFVGFGPGLGVVLPPGTTSGSYRNAVVAAVAVFDPDA